VDSICIGYSTYEPTSVHVTYASSRVGPCTAAEVELDSAGFKHSWRTLIKAFYSNVTMLNCECVGDSAFIIFCSYYNNRVLFRTLFLLKITVYFLCSSSDIQKNNVSET
jgi:hypothetical protein